MRRTLKFLILIIFIALIGFSISFGTRGQAKADVLLEIARTNSGINMSDLVLSEDEAEELGLSAAQAQNACTVYRALANINKFSAQTFIVAYLTDGGEPVPANEIVEAGSRITRPPDPVKPGYVFKHWEYKYPCDNRTYAWNFDSDVVGFNMVLVAIYDSVSADIYYDVDFDVNGGLPVPNSQKVKQGDKIEKPIAPFKLGYDFLGWYNNGQKWDFDNDTVNGDMLLTAEYDSIAPVDSYSVVFDADGGEPVPPAQIVVKGNKVTKPANPTKEGYIFVEWQCNGLPWDFDVDAVNYNIILKAKWIDISESIKVTWYDCYRNTYRYTYVKFGDTINQIDNPADPTGYRFFRWTYNCEEWNFNTPVTQDIQLSAQYASTKYWIIEHDSNGGAFVPKSLCLNNGTYVVPEAPIWTGADAKTFAGWQLDGNIVGYARVSKDLTFTAIWR